MKAFGVVGGLCGGSWGTVVGIVKALCDDFCGGSVVCISAGRIA